MRFWGAQLALLASVGSVLGTYQTPASGSITIYSRTTAASTVASSPLAIAVSGNQLIDGSGNTVRLLGVNRSGLEFACIQGWGPFDGPNDAASVAAMAGWHINVVRLPLNEDCWLGINGVNPALSGTAYQSAVRSYVKLLHQYGLYAILDLHWNAPGASAKTVQEPMPDADHAPDFWRSVASYFKDDPAVLFDLYNEPHDVSWGCWLNGCIVSGWQAAGMQSLVDAVRSAGATQPIMIGGLGWANYLSGWLANEPIDPANALVASFHNYNWLDCFANCWATTIASVASRVPVVTGEIGENDCNHDYIDPYMAWADAHGISYLGWTWNTWDCVNGPALISDYTGTPTPFGIGLRDHLRFLAMPSVVQPPTSTRPRLPWFGGPIRSTPQPFRRSPLASR